MNSTSAIWRPKAGLYLVPDPVGPAALPDRLEAEPPWAEARRRYQALCREREAEIARAGNAPSYRAKVAARRFWREAMAWFRLMGEL